VRPAGRRAASDDRVHRRIGPLLGHHPIGMTFGRVTRFPDASFKERLPPGHHRRGLGRAFTPGQPDRPAGSAVPITL